MLKTFDAVLGTGEKYLESDEGSEGIAAPEVIACLRGHPAPLNPDAKPLAAWMASETAKRAKP